MSTEQRQAAEARGRLAETLAAWRLRLSGYAILARRERNPAGEIDLIARRGRTVAFVEVKARTTAEPEGPVSARQWARIGRAAELFLARRRDLATCELRFDLILVGGLWPRHRPDAWRP